MISVVAPDLLHFLTALALDLRQKSCIFTRLNK